MMEALCGCEGENRYSISAADDRTETESSLPFLHAKEKSECLHRLCLEYLFISHKLTLNSGNCRPFEMEIQDMN